MSNHAVVRKLVMIILAITAVAFVAGCADGSDSSSKTPESAGVTQTQSSLNSVGVVPASAEPKVGSVDTLVDGLRAKLENNPNDVKGWVLLGKSYQFLQRWPEAEEAFAKARALGYVEDGMDAGVANSATSSAAPAVMPGSFSQPVFDSIGKMAGETVAAGGINVNVSIDERLVPTLPPETVVYIFARSVSKDSGAASGPPLAVAKKKVSELPLTLELNDSMAMMPQFALSTVDEVMIGARISHSGNPVKQPGDIEKIVGPVPTSAAKAVTIVIADVITGGE